MKSRYVKDWYGIVLNRIKHYPGIKESDSKQNQNYVKAIEDALESTKETEDGELKVKAMELLYFENRYTIDGVAFKLNVSRRTLQRWTSSFVYLVGKNVGF